MRPATVTVAALALLTLTPAPRALAGAPSPTAPASDRLVVGSGLRLRAAPDANAAVLSVVPLGTVLACTEESKPVTVASTTAPFCRSAGGWYFTALTEPLDLADPDAQLLRLLERRRDELTKGPVDAKTLRADVYELHALLRKRVAATTGERQVRARLMELSWVAANADHFEKDARVYRDESAGFRVKNEVFSALLDASKGSAAHDDVAWAAYQHGMPGECEGYAGCMFFRALITACAYAQAFPGTPRANEAMQDVLGTLQEAAKLEGECTENDSPSCSTFGDSDDAKASRKESASHLGALTTCVRKAKAGDQAALLSAIAAAEKRYAR